MTDESEIGRFLDKIAFTSTCWMWTAGVRGDGYGAFALSGPKRQIGAHRYAYELWVGPVDMQVLHHCDTPLCVNPDHLFLGSHKDNMRDKAQKKRTAGQRNPRALLSDEQATEIRIRCRQGQNKRQIAEEFGVKLLQIQRIASGFQWSKVTK